MAKDKVTMHTLRKMMVDGVLLGSLTVSLLAIEYLWPPFKRGFFCGDESLMFPYKNDTVTNAMLRSVGITPVLSFLICEFVLLRNEENDQRIFCVRIPAWIRGFYCVCMTFAIGACFCEMAVDIAKKTIGRPRPHFFDLCKPSVNCSEPEWQHRYVTAEEFFCTSGKTDMFTNMRMSFVSGHSAWASYCLIYMALYLERRMTWPGTRLLRHTIQFAVVMMSWYCALSRVSDYKHHWSDVLAGYALGSAIAVVLWKYCTDLVQKKKHTPIPQFEVS